MIAFYLVFGLNVALSLSLLIHVLRRRSQFKKIHSATKLAIVAASIAYLFVGFVPVILKGITGIEGVVNDMLEGRI